MDGLTKIFIAGKYNIFVKIISIESQTDFLAFIQKKKNLRDTLQCRIGPIKNNELFGYSANAT